ncbi:4919_t:CDS:2 [Gigaspora rosea]|nr:4919_t:CDS:2 [Gigaspora rosea]
MRKVHQVEHMSKIAVSSFVGNENIPPKSVGTPLQGVVNTSNNEIHEKDWHKSSGKKSDLTDVALLNSSDESVTKDIAANTEGKSTADVNNPYTDPGNNVTNEEDSSEKASMDLSISDDENLKELMETENHESKVLETEETDNSTLPTENKLESNLETGDIEEVNEIAISNVIDPRANPLEAGNIEEVNEMINSNVVKSRANSNTNVDEEGFTEVTYKRQKGRNRDNTTQYVGPYDKDRRKGKHVPKKVRNIRFGLDHVTRDESKRYKNARIFKRTVDVRFYLDAKTAILAGNNEILFKETQVSFNGRILETQFLFRQHQFRIMNVYAPPTIEERMRFFSAWSLTKKEDAINIIAGDFNTNITDINRISQAPSHNDPTRQKLEMLMEGMIDTAIVAEQSPFLTFYQKTRGQNLMTTRLDYIFLEDHELNFEKNTSCRAYWQWEQKSAGRKGA